MPELVALSYSPWSEKARWALDHHRVAYTEVEHQILLGEPWLRWKTRRPFGRVSVPTLIDGPRVYRDSLEIARYAEWFGSGPPLFGDDTSAIARWNAVSERGLAAGRVLGTERIARDPRAKEEHLPAFVPTALRPAMRPVASLGVAFLRRKYAFDAAQRAEAHLEDVLRELREALAGGDHLLGGVFGYADIAMSQVLAFVRPHARTPLGPAARDCWTHPRLAAAYSDLLAWRDRLYLTHRVP